MLLQMNQAVCARCCYNGTRLCVATMEPGCVLLDVATMEPGCVLLDVATMEPGCVQCCTYHLRQGSGLLLLTLKWKLILTLFDLYLEVLNVYNNERKRMQYPASYPTKQIKANTEEEKVEEKRKRQKRRRKAKKKMSALFTPSKETTEKEIYERKVTARSAFPKNSKINAVREIDIFTSK